MQVTFFSFVMSLLWFNLYIIIINIFRRKDNFIISFSTFPLVFFLFLSILRLIFNFEIPSSIIIRSGNIFPQFYNLIREPSYLKAFNVNILQLLIFVWGLVFSMLAVNNTFKYKEFKRSLDRLEESKNKENQKTFNKILNQKKVINKIEVIQHDKISSPFMLGILKGKIYIPNISFSQKELEYIILHEINHFLRRDSLKKIIIQIIKYIFWWNPFAHSFANNFNHILEIQCDLKTTAGFSNEEKIRYLESITKIIKASKETGVQYELAPNFVDIKDVDFLKQRFRIVLNYKKKKNFLFNISNIGVCLLAILFYISSYFVIIQPDYKPNDSDIYQVEETVEDSFIIEKPNGGYKIYIKNVFKYSVDNLEDLNENLRSLPIYKGKED